MKKLLAALVTLCVAGTALFAIPALAATKSVAVKDDKFAPKSLTVKKGTTLKFVWKGKHPHNVVALSVPSGAKKFRSKTQKKGSYKVKVSKKGTYRIHCEIHPGMNLSVKAK
jgi:plastocyanin